MEPGNETQILEFLLLGFSEEPELQPFLFGFFLSMYLVTVLGNLLIVLATITDSHLHTPMYFFLSNLYFADTCLSSTTVPKMLVNLQTQRKVISNADCLTQMSFLLLFVALENFLLTMMSYDLFMAIYHPLHYTVIMNPQLCVLLLLGCWIISVLYALSQRSLVLQLSFCTPLEIPHFFYEYNQMIQLACSNTFLNDIVMCFVAGLLGGGSFIVIIFSYSKIVSSIRAISSALGKYKAFSTCASHLTVVSLFYCTSIGVFISSSSMYSAHASAPTSVLYFVLIPMLNPFIYSLRNKDIKGALKGFLSGNP